MNSTLTLLPAYGRDYKSKTAIINDLNASKDFIVSHTGQYINKPQFKEHNIISFNVRYNNQLKITNINIKDLNK